MECDTLFADSDDDVELLPSSIETNTRNERVSKAANATISSNYVNSSSPLQYDVNMPLTHPPSSDTPIPEEYQPLPDSSSALNYILTNSGLDAGAQSSFNLADVNIRYQPKPRNIYCPSYSQYLPGVVNPHPTRELIGTPYQADTVYVLSDERNYSRHPLTYTIAPNHNHTYLRQDGLNGMRYDQVQPIDNIYAFHGHEPTSDDDFNASSAPINLERPSRKLNISPRHRNLKHSGDSSNTIEVSSEDEDNSNSQNRYIGTSENNSENIVSGNSAPRRVDVKQEPGVRCKIEATATGDGETSNINQPDQVARRRRSLPYNYSRSNSSGSSENRQCAQTIQVKQENNSTSSLNINGHNQPCSSTSSNSQDYKFNTENNAIYQERPSTSSSGNNIANIKQETHNIKQELDSSNAMDEQIEIPIATTVKVESLTEIKIESRAMDLSGNLDSVVVKVEHPPSRTHSDVVSGDDRNNVHRSPEPGPSAGPSSASQMSNSNNTYQVIILFFILISNNFIY